MTTQQKRRLFPRSARFGLLIAILAATITGVVSGLHTRTEHRQGLDDLERRAELLAHRSAPAATLRGLANGSLPSAISRSFRRSKSLASMMASPRMARKGGTGRSSPRRRSGTLCMVRTLAVIPSPRRPSPRVDA